MRPAAKPSSRRAGLDERSEPGAEATLQLHRRVTYRALAERATVHVPAGAFAGCLAMVMTVEAPTQRWQTTSHDVPGVGLVREEQVDRQGRTTYTLELSPGSG